MNKILDIVSKYGIPVIYCTKEFADKNNFAGIKMVIFEKEINSNIDAFIIPVTTINKPIKIVFQD